MTGAPSQRIDRWLWHARIFRTRSLASRFATSGKVRVNAGRITKPSHAVAVGDVLTFVLNRRLRVLAIAGIADRRGPFQDARLLYDDQSPESVPEDGTESGPSAPKGGPRPTKLERRQRDAFTGRANESC